MSTHNLCFEQKYEKYQNFLSDIFHFLVVKFSVYLNRHVFVMFRNIPLIRSCGMVVLMMKMMTWCFTSHSKLFNT